MRRVASSRVRWATVIESVLKITNAPTSSAMPPKISRKARIFEISCFQSPTASLNGRLAALDLQGRGEQRLDARSSCRAVVPGLA